MSSVTRSRETELSAQAMQQIDRLMARYCSAIDNGNFEQWPELFTSDGVYQIMTRTDHEAGRTSGIWFCNNRGMLQDRVSAIRSVNVYEPHSYRHVIGPTEVLAVEGADVECETGYIVVRTGMNGDMLVFSAGRYVDRVRFEAGAALLVSRTVITDSARFDTLVALPL